MTALVTRANSPKALITVRSLGRRGIRVSTADKQRFALSSFSKYSEKFFLYPSPTRSQLMFINSLISILKKYKHDVLMPVHSEDTYIIAKFKPRLEYFTKVPLKDYSTIMKVNDKGYLMQVARDLGIPVPKTYYFKEFNELTCIANKIDFPAVIKLRDSSSSIGISYVYSEEELILKCKETISRFNLSPSNYPIIQEYIRGDGYGVSLLFNQGDLRAKFTHKRLREYPITGGPSTYRVSVKDSKMESHAIKLLKYFNWHGVAMVEFKMDSETRNPILMEINPRFWGSLNQAIKSGVDFPYLLYNMALEGDIKPVLNYKVGVKTKNFFIDSIAIFNHVRKIKKIGLIKQFFSFAYDDIISPDDPLPVLSFILTGMGHVARVRNSLG